MAKATDRIKERGKDIAQQGKQQVPRAQQKIREVTDRMKGKR
ncbi:MAG TPA: hypothetical protein VIL44_12105 [Micromonospora sp.]|jgi:hypothetical protein